MHFKRTLGLIGLAAMLLSGWRVEAQSALGPNAWIRGSNITISANAWIANAYGRFSGDGSGLTNLAAFGALLLSDTNSFAETLRQYSRDQTNNSVLVRTTTTGYTNDLMSKVGATQLVNSAALLLVNTNAFAGTLRTYSDTSSQNSTSLLSTRLTANLNDASNALRGATLLLSDTNAFADSILDATVAKAGGTATNLTAVPADGDNIALTLDGGLLNYNDILYLGTNTHTWGIRLTNAIDDIIGMRVDQKGSNALSQAGISLHIVDGGGDSYVGFGIEDVANVSMNRSWHMGMDNSADEAFQISGGGSLGVNPGGNPYFKIDRDSGQVTIIPVLAQGDKGLTVVGYASSNDTTAAIGFRFTTAAVDDHQVEFRGIRTGVPASGATALTLSTHDGNSLVERMRIDGNGLTTTYGTINVGSTGIVVSAAGVFWGNGIKYYASGNNSSVSTTDGGTIISRNLGDSTRALAVQQLHASSTGDIVQFQNSGGAVVTIKQSGQINAVTNANIGGTLTVTNNIVAGWSGQFHGNGAGLTNTDGNGFSTTNWVIDAISSLGTHIYSSGVTNTTLMYETAVRTNQWIGYSTVVTNTTTNTVGGFAANHYIRHIVSEQMFSRIEDGPIAINAWIARTSGAGTLTIQPVIYYLNGTNLVQLASGAAQAISGAAPARYAWSVSVSSTNLPVSSPLIWAWKCAAPGSGTPILEFVSGGDYDSHASLVQAASSSALTVLNLTVNGFMKFSTNALVASGGTDYLLNMNSPYNLHIAAGNIAITNLSNVDMNKVNNYTLLINDGGAERTLTVPADWYTHDGSHTYYVSNAANIAVLSVCVYPNAATNAVFRLFNQ